MERVKDNSGYPCTNISAPINEMDLLRLVEECGEVIQAATKILRFGVYGTYCDGRPNMKVLIDEVGDVLACIKLLELPPHDLADAIKRKKEKIEKVRKYELGFDSLLTREQREKLHGEYKP